MISQVICGSTMTRAYMAGRQSITPSSVLTLTFAATIEDPHFRCVVRASFMMANVMALHSSAWLLASSVW